MTRLFGFLFLLLTLSLFTSSCGQEMKPAGELSLKSKNSNPTNEEQEDQAPQKGRRSVCYTSQKGQTCIEQSSFDELANEAKLYRYKDPYNSSSFPFPGKEPFYNPPVFFLDLRSSSSGLPVSQNFSLSEYVRTSNQRGHFGVLTRKLVSVVQSIRSELRTQLKVNSGYRSPAFNESLSQSANWSRHMYGDAVDFKPIGNTSLKSLAEQCIKRQAGFVKIYEGHVHCDWRYDDPDTSFFPLSQPAPTVDNHAFHKLQHQFDLNEATRLVPHPANSRTRAYFTIETYQEDEGQLLLEWKITKAGKLVSQGNSAQIPQPQPPGVYDILVTIGGYQNFESQFEVQ